MSVSNLVKGFLRYHFSAILHYSGTEQLTNGLRRFINVLLKQKESRSTCFLKKWTTVELRAQPTNPKGTSGLCMNRTSSGIKPSFPRSMVWMSLWFSQSQKYNSCPYKPVIHPERLEQITLKLLSTLNNETLKVAELAL